MPKEREAKPQPTRPDHKSCSQLSWLHTVNHCPSQLCFIQHKAHTEVLDPIPLSSCLEPIMSPEVTPLNLI